MADEKFHFSSGEILMKEVFLIFFFLDEKKSYIMVSYSVKKQRLLRATSWYELLAPLSNLHTYIRGVLLPIFFGALFYPSAHNVSPTGKIEPRKKSVIERPLIYVCKVKMACR